MHHLEPLPDLSDEAPDELAAPLRRPSWWRPVAVLLIVALVVATPFAFALYRLLR